MADFLFFGGLSGGCHLYSLLGHSRRLQKTASLWFCLRIGIDWPRPLCRGRAERRGWCKRRSYTEPPTRLEAGGLPIFVQVVTLAGGTVDLRSGTRLISALIEKLGSPQITPQLDLRSNIMKVRYWATSNGQWMTGMRALC